MQSSDIFNKMTELQTKLLCYLAYTGFNFNERSIADFLEIQNISQYSIPSYQRALRFNGLLDKDDKIIDNMVMPSLLWMFKHHYQWATEFKSIVGIHSRIRRYPLAVDLAEALSKNQPTIFLQEFNPYLHYELFSLVYPIFKDIKKICDSNHMSLSVFIHFVPELIWWLISNDIDASEELLSCWQTHPIIKEDDVWQMTLKYVFYATGVLHEDCNTDAQTLLNGKDSLLNIPLGNYLYGRYLATQSDTKFRIDMIHISESGDIRSRIETVPLYLLARCFKDDRHYVDDFYLSKFAEYVNSTDSNGLRCIEFLLCSRLKRRPTVDYEAHKIVPNLWIFRKEIESLNPLSYPSDEQKQTTTQISTTRRENKTPQQDETAIQKTGATSISPTTYIVYVVGRGGTFAPFLCDENKESKKKTFKEISILDFATGKLPKCLVEDIDRQIWIVWNKSGRRFRLIDMMRLLKDSGKLYTHLEGKFTKAKLVYDPLYLAIEQEESSLVIKSNVNCYDICDNTNVVFKVKDGQILYTLIPTQHFDDIKLLLRQGTYPQDSEERLRSIFLKLRSDVEIRSDIYASGADVLSYDSSSQIVIRISELKNNHKNRLIKCYCRPLPDCKALFTAGIGATEPTVYLDGKRCKAIRDLNRENELTAELYNTLHDSGCKLKTYGKDNDLFFIELKYVLEIIKFVEEHADDFSIEWQCSRVNLKKVDKKSLQLHLKRHEDWFELEGSVNLDTDNDINLRDFFNEVLNQDGEFIKIREHDFIHIADSLRHQIRTLASGFNDTGHHLRTSKMGVALMADTITELDTAGEHEFLASAKEKMNESLSMNFDVPGSLSATLRPYQQVGYEWMSRLSYWGAGACLADDMGLGKTLQSITFILANAVNGASLVVAPASVVNNWKNEINRFAPTLHTIVLNASKNRSAQISKASNNDVVIITYGLLVSMKDELKGREWNIICLDEAHTIKNKSTQTSSAAMDLKCRCRLALTGTPIQNNLSELWNIYQFTNPGLLGSYDKFVKKYVHPIMDNKNMERQEQLKRIISPFMLRRTKDEVAKELPTKKDETILVNLSDGEMAVYEKIRKAALAKAEESEKKKIEILSEITKLRLASCCVSLQNKGWTGPCSKLSAFMDKIKQICAKDKDARVLVFSQFTSFLEMAGDRLKEDGHEYLYLDGQTTIRQRANLVDSFQNGDCPLFLISLQAGGLGLNLTAANYVILLDPWWNPAIEQQAIDRAYRIGQQRDVSVYHLISCNTIEEKIVRLQQTKKDLATALLTGNEMTGKITYEQLKVLIEK